MNANTIQIAKIANVTIDEATTIHEVIDAQWLVDWSEDSTAKVRKAIKLAQSFIANGNTWAF